MSYHPLTSHPPFRMGLLQRCTRELGPEPTSRFLLPPVPPSSGQFRIALLHNHLSAGLRLELDPTPSQEEKRGEEKQEGGEKL